MFDWIQNTPLESVFSSVTRQIAESLILKGKNLDGDLFRLKRSVLCNAKFW